MSDVKNAKEHWEVIGRYVETDTDIICEMFGDNIAERDANARLIAAAPELLEALEGVIDAADYAAYQGFGGDGTVNQIIIARSLIAKVKGEA